MSPETIMTIANQMFGWDIDFALDIREGDEFSVLYEQKYQDGEYVNDGRVLAWGCGGPDFTSQCRVPPAARQGVRAIAAGDYHSLALTKDGRVVAWGCDRDSGAGQCSVPAAARRGVRAIAAGTNHSLALKDGR